ISPTVSAPAMLRSTPRRISTGPASLVSVSRTSSRSIMGAPSAEFTAGSVFIDAYRRIVGGLGRGLWRACTGLRYGVVPALFNVGVVVATLLSAGTAPAGAGEPAVIMAFGDSLSAGYGLSEAESFTGQLEADLRARG